MILKLFYAFLFALTGYLAFQVYTLYDARRSLTNIPEEYSFGAENADLLIVEFLDYSCIYCQQTHPVIMEALTLDGNARLAPRPMLSNNADGTSGAYIFYAAAKQGKAAQVHAYLMENGSNLTKERLPEIAAALEIDETQFIADVNSKEVHEIIKKNNDHLFRLGGYGTPTFFIGPDILYLAKDEMPTSEHFLTVFQEARELQ